MAEKLTFSWNNYLRPTPENLQRIAAMTRRVIGGIGVTSVFAEADKWTTFSIITAGLILDELTNFFGIVAKDKGERVVIDYPPEVADKVNVTIEQVPTTEEETK